MGKFVDVTFGEALEKFQEFSWLFTMCYTSIEFNKDIINAKRNIWRIKDLLELDKPEFTLLDENFTDRFKTTRYYVTNSQAITNNEKYDRYEEAFIDFLIDAYSIKYNFNTITAKRKAYEAYNEYIEQFKVVFSKSEYKDEIIGTKPFAVRKNAMICALKSLGKSMQIENILNRSQNICDENIRKIRTPFVYYLTSSQIVKNRIEKDENEINQINYRNREMHKPGRYVSPEVAKLADNVCYNYLKSIKKENQEECNIQ